MIRHAIHEFLHDYEWVHITIGIVGNATFFVGSILFLPTYEGWMTVGVWLFIAGSLMMMLGALGSGLKRILQNAYGPPGRSGASPSAPLG